jgi:transcriptional regulator with GAF, ATPase, and Fis domain
MAPRNPSSGPAEVLDPTHELQELAALAAEPGRVDDLLARALDALAQSLPYDLAAVLELAGDELVVRCARGRLAGELRPGRVLRLSEHPLLRAVLEARRTRTLDEEDHARGLDPYHGLLELEDGHACMLVPLSAGDRVLGALTFDRARCEPYGKPVVELATVYGQIIALALQAAEQAALLESYRARLEERNRLLEGEVTGPGHAGGRIVGFESAAMRELAATARQVAVTDAPVLITGETGSGKEVLARAIHGWSRRARKPFVKLNCAALPEGLVESELFGHKRGAFSGATADRLGRFAVASGGTLLLDEIGDLPPGAQAKLLRVLQEGSFEPVGSDRTVQVDVRIVAATHVDLEQAIEQGRFRRDLFYRLNVLPLRVPPLRERAEDIGRLSREILDDTARRTGRGPWRLGPDTLADLEAYRWPGNVRELVNVLERAAVLSEEETLRVHLPRARPGAATPGLATLAEVERAHLERVLEATGGKLYGRGGAAEILGLKPSTLQSRMRKLGVKRLPAAR